MAITEGTEWTSGKADPDPELVVPATLWGTPSSNPCSTCASREGVTFIDAPQLPAHDFCSCTGQSVEVHLKHVGRAETGQATEEVKEYRGFIEEPDSDRPNERTFALPDESTQTVGCEQDAMNTTSRCEVYYVYDQTTTTYEDTYEPVEQVDDDDPQTREAVKVVTVFRGVETERGDAPDDGSGWW